MTKRQLKDFKITTENLYKFVNEFSLYLRNTNPREYNQSKLNEELFELGEVINKHFNKSPDKKPTMKEIISEINDVLFRLMVVFDIEEEDGDVLLLEKMQRLQSYIGKYDKI